MDMERVHPQLRAMAAKAPKIDVGNPLLRVIARFVSRHLLPAANLPGVTVRNVTEHGVRVRRYTPQEPSGAGLIWVHGGGMVIGGPRQDDRFCAETAAITGATVISVDYRMAPEHPYPAPQDDVRAAWQWAQQHAADLGLDPGRIALGGGSAGAGIAASVVNALHDAGGMQPVAQWLLYPMLDDRTAARTELDVLEHYVWDNRANRIGWSALLRGIAEPGTDAVPAGAAPARRLDLSGLPPTWVGVGDIDLFHDEDVAYADRLRSAGVEVALEVIPGAPHGFESLAPEAPVVHDLIAGARDWLARRMI